MIGQLENKWGNENTKFSSGSIQITFQAFSKLYLKRLALYLLTCTELGLSYGPIGLMQTILEPVNK